MASDIRGKLGESLSSVQRFDAPVEKVTTPSLEALQAYSLGRRAAEKNTNDGTAVALFERAIGFDSNFAMAYAELGVSYANLNQTARAVHNIRKAYELRERTSEREKLYIAAHYADMVTGNLDAALKTYDLWTQLYPRDPVPVTNSNDIYTALGAYDKALASSQAALKLDPQSSIDSANMLLDYLALSRLEEVKNLARQAQAQNLDAPVFQFGLYFVDFLQHDAAGAKRQAEWLLGNPGWEHIVLQVESDSAAYGGQSTKSRELTRHASNSALRIGSTEAAAGYRAEAAVREALVGNSAMATQDAQTALALSRARDVESISAVAVALAGDSAMAAGLAHDLSKRFPENTIVQFSYLPIIRAGIALHDHSYHNAIDVLRAAEPYEFGSPSQVVSFLLYPIYVRGLALLANGQGTDAAAEFKKILDRPGLVLNEPIAALAHLQLGRAHLLQGESAEAKVAYEAFLTLWKDADPDIPILKQAKAEYAKLQ